MKALPSEPVWPSSVRSMPQDPAAMGRAIQAIMAQAGAWVAQYKS